MHRGETSAHREVAAPLIMSLSTNVSGMINPRSWSSSASVIGPSPAADSLVSTPVERRCRDDGGPGGAREQCLRIG